jgi:uncharacterized protein YbjT (DUF2867 family)
MINYPKKKDLESILVFGASAHIGKPLARYVTENAPGVRLRLATSSAEKSIALKREFPNAEVVVADYYDLPSMRAATEEMEGIFLVSPDFLDENIAMSIFRRAVTENNALVHAIRILADPPGVTLRRVPKEMHAFGGGTAIQNLIAKDFLEASELPVTFLNSAGWYFDNYLSWLAPPILKKRTLTMSSPRQVLYFDPGELGEVAARILLSDDARHIGGSYQCDNGQDLLTFEDAANMMTEVFGVKIAYDGSEEGFMREIGEPARAYWANVGGFARGQDPAEYFLAYWRFEQANEHAWRRTDFAERILQRRPKTLRQWLIENRDFFINNMST